MAFSHDYYFVIRVSVHIVVFPIFIYIYRYTQPAVHAGKPVILNIQGVSKSLIRKNKL